MNLKVDGTTAREEKMRRVIVSTFPNAKALPLWAGVEHNLFAEHGLDFILHETGSSKEQRTLLAAGEINIVQAAVDNALAMIKSGHDVIIFMGGEGGMNDFIVTPSIRSFSDLAGRTLAVDLPDTAYALLARKVLAQHGLRTWKETTSCGQSAMAPSGCARSRRIPPLRAPSSIRRFHPKPCWRACEALAPSTILSGLTRPVGHSRCAPGPKTTRRPSNAISPAYLHALQWLGDDANRNAGVDLLRQRLGLTMAVAQATYEQLRDPNKGFTPRAKFNQTGFVGVLNVRAETEGVDAVTANPAAYVDLSFYDRVAGVSDRLR